MSALDKGEREKSCADAGQPIGPKPLPQFRVFVYRLTQASANSRSVDATMTSTLSSQLSGPELSDGGGGLVAVGRQIEMPVAARDWSTVAGPEWARPRCGSGGKEWASGWRQADRVVWAA